MQMRHLAQIEGQIGGVTAEKAGKLTSREYSVGEIDGSTRFSLIRVLGAVWRRRAVEGKVVQRLGHRFMPAAAGELEVALACRCRAQMTLFEKWAELVCGRSRALYTHHQFHYRFFSCYCFDIGPESKYDPESSRGEWRSLILWSVYVALGEEGRAPLSHFRVLSRLWPDSSVALIYPVDRSSRPFPSPNPVSLASFLPPCACVPFLLYYAPISRVKFDKNTVLKMSIWRILALGASVSCCGPMSRIPCLRASQLAQQKNEPPFSDLSSLERLKRKTYSNQD